MMNLIIRTALLSSLLFFILFPGVQGQVKYDFAALVYNPANKEIKFSHSTNPVQTIKLEKGDFESHNDLTPAIKLILKMQSEGWELFNTGDNMFGTAPTYLFYLRKKQQ